MTRPDDTFVRLILVGVDGSRGSGLALEWAAKLARSTGARTVAGHVLTYDQELLRDFSLDTMHTWRRELEREFRSDWVQPLVTAGVDHDCEFLEADSPAEGLLELVDRINPDVLVVGARGRGGLVGRVLGSTSYRLVQHSHRPVIVVPPG